MLGSRVKCGRDSGVILRLHSALGGVDVGVILGVILGVIGGIIEPRVTWYNLALPCLAFRSEVAEHLTLPGVMGASWGAGYLAWPGRDNSTIYRNKDCYW